MQQVENDKFDMRAYLNRIELIGDEFQNCQEHLESTLMETQHDGFGQHR